MAIGEAIMAANGGAGQPGSGSLGAVGTLFHDSRNVRVKGFLTQPILAPDSLGKTLAGVKSEAAGHGGATRTTIRVFMGRNLAEQARHMQLPYDIEAVIPVGPALPGMDIVYFGKNHQERMPDAHTMSEERKNLAKVLCGTNPVPRTDAIARAERGGYSLSLLTSASQNDVQALLSIYREAFEKYTFELNEAAINYMLGNGNKMFVARGKAGQIASVLVAEECEIKLDDGRNVLIYELSDFATSKTDRGNGLITALQHMAIGCLRNIAPHSVIYAEDRAPWLPVLKSSKEAGMRYHGTLPFHCTLVSDRTFDYQKGHDFETLHVFVAPHMRD